MNPQTLIPEQNLAGPQYMSWYVRPIGKTDPLFEKPNEEDRVTKLQRLSRRGKTTPKKGSGKRALKKK
jgi:hypothetical protein